MVSSVLDIGKDVKFLVAGKKGSFEPVKIVKYSVEVLDKNTVKSLATQALQNSKIALDLRTPAKVKLSKSTHKVLSQSTTKKKNPRDTEALLNMKELLANSQPREEPKID